MVPIFGKLNNISEAEIFSLWNDSKFPVASFPLVNVEFACARLTAFQSLEEWLTIFEFIGFNTEAGLCLNDVHAHGNKVKKKRYWFNHRVIDPLNNDPAYPFFETDNAGNSLINPLDFTVQVKGNKRSYSLETKEYERLGIDLNNTSVDSLTKILRYLCSTNPDAVFLNTEEQLNLVGRPNNLQQFKLLNDWYHPDYRLGEKLEDSPCLQSLATALASQNSALYDCPSNIHNTHWSNWENT